MDNKQIENAIKKGIESKGAIKVDEAIVNAILSDEVQNGDFMSQIPTDKVTVEAIDENIDAIDKASENEKEDTEKQDNNKSFGKFKNPEELLKAYRELEKEFTKKSQKLAKLEAQKDDDNQGFDEDSFKVAVDKFFENTPSAKPFARDIARKIIESPELKQDKNCLNIALMQVLIDKFRTPEQLMQDGQFLNDYVLQSSKVKDAIISTYLKDIREGQPPKTLSADGLQCVAPSRKIRSIEEAGRLFLKNNE